MVKVINIDKMDEIAKNINNDGIEIKNAINNVFDKIEDIRNRKKWIGNRFYSFVVMINTELENFNKIIKLFCYDIPNTIDRCSNCYKNIFNNNETNKSTYSEVKKINSLKLPKLENTIGIDEKTIEDAKNYIKEQLRIISQKVDKIIASINELENYWNDNTKSFYLRNYSRINKISEYVVSFNQVVMSYLQNASIILSNGIMID